MGINENANRRIIRNIILSLLVLSSLLLSFSLWTTGKSINEENNSSNQAKPSRVSVVTHSLEEVYRPKLIALHGIFEDRPLVITRSYSLVEQIEDIMEKSNLKNIERVNKITKEDYLKRLESGSWLEFVYPEKIPFGLIESKFTDLSKEDEELFFDRIIFDQKNRSKIYFYHMASESFYTARRKADEKINIGGLFAEDTIEFIEAEVISLAGAMRYLPINNLEISRESYIVNQFPSRSYINNFFQDTSLVDVRSANKYTRYIDLTKEVTINENTHVLSYLSQIYQSDQLDIDERYEKSFQQMNQFENWTDSLIFSAYDADRERLYYRREIKGIPVFSENDEESLMEISLVEEGITHMKLPLRFINIPIDIKDETKKTLLSGVEMIENLRQKLTAEEFNLIEDCMIGYSWIESDEDDQVINFDPNWYLLYEGKWLSYSSLLEIEKETVYGF